MVKLLIARHGNTFTKEQTPTRVGARTDLPLTESERGINLGLYLKQENLVPDVVFSAPLKRTLQTACLALGAMGRKVPVYVDQTFTEIDYGPDENKTDAEVIARIGQGALDRWNAEAIVPDGWLINPAEVIENWKKFAGEMEQKYADKTVLVVSSNGIIRFAPYLTGDFDAFSTQHDIKVGTGNVCLFEKNAGDQNWTCTFWNVKPKDHLR